MKPFDALLVFGTIGLVVGSGLCILFYPHRSDIKELLKVMFIPTPLLLRWRWNIVVNTIPGAGVVRVDIDNVTFFVPENHYRNNSHAIGRSLLDYGRLPGMIMLDPHLRPSDINIMTMTIPYSPNIARGYLVDVVDWEREGF